MKRSALIAAALVLAVSPAVATPAFAGTNSTTRTTRTTGSLSAQQMAAFEAADRMAEEAPYLSTGEKAANADRLAEILQIDGITVQQRAIAIGKTQLGTYYRWGGTTPSGFDCSGFTRFAFRKAGVTLPRTAAQQQRAVTRVYDPQPGDLVFIGRPAHHVGIYVGDGKMLHSPRTGKAIQVARIWTKANYGRV